MIINIEEEKMKPRLYMIIPCYNEEKVLPIYIRNVSGRAEFIDNKR